MYTVTKEDNGAPIKVWGVGVPMEEDVLDQLKQLSKLPFVRKHLALMPDGHKGNACAVGSVIPTRGAIIPAAVGVDLGCGMAAVRLDLKASDLPTSLKKIREDIEKAVPHGRSDHGGKNDIGSWHVIPPSVVLAWKGLMMKYEKITEKHPTIMRGRTYEHVGTLGGGNHFVELCLDEEDYIWIMLHSGSRGPGNRIGSYFIERAKEEMRRWYVNLPDEDMAYLPERSELFEDYWEAVQWAQVFARINRDIMLEATIGVLSKYLPIKFDDFEIAERAVNCHHNYVTLENHFGENLYITRKGAVRARVGDLGIIPGAMGRKSFIVRGKGEPQSFMSCSHGAGRVRSRKAAKRILSIEDVILETEGLECAKGLGVRDELPSNYKDIDAVMAAQADLVDIVHTLRAIMTVKGEEA